MKKILLLSTLVVCAFALNVSAQVHNVNSNADFADLNSAVTAATSGDSLVLTGDLTLTSNVPIAKTIKLNGDGHTITTSGGSYILSFNPGSDGSLVRNLIVNKTDKTSQNIFFINANNFLLDNVDFTGQFVIGDVEASRGMEVAGNLSNLVIQNCSFSHLRQPAYINNSTKGKIINNYTEYSKGWVIVANTQFEFSGNTWGTGAAANAVDFAFISGSLLPIENFYNCNIAKIAADNTNANIDNQLPGGVCIAHNAARGTNYTKIQYAIDAGNTVDGDIITVDAGTVNEAVVINRPIELRGAQYNVTPRPSQGSTRMIDDASETILTAPKNKHVIEINSDNVTINGFELKQSGGSGTADAVKASNAQSDINVSYNIVTNSTDEGIQLESGTNYLVQNNYIYKSTGDGITFSSYNVSPISGTNLQIIGNDIDSSTSSYGSIYLYGTQNVTIDGNVINTKSTGIASGSDGLPANNVTIQNNTINTELRTAYSALATGIGIDGNSSNVNIHNNYINQVGGYVPGANNDRYNIIRVGVASTANPSDVVINNNFFFRTANENYIYVNPNVTNTINATCNWWGSTDIATINTLIHDNANDVVDNFLSYLDAGGNSNVSPAPGFTPMGNCVTPSQPFITQWVTTDGSITIPTTGTGYNYTISWKNLTTPGVGNGSATGQTGNYTITGLTNNDTYEVSISGDFPRINMNSIVSERPKIMKVTQWGDIQWTNMKLAFAKCSNLDITATDTPDLSNVTNLSEMFINCTSLVGSTANWHWDVSHVTNMASMFQQTTNFNQDISSWDISSVTNMSDLFQNATSFNQDISSWDVSSVTNMSNLFRNATSFNQNLGSWNVSSATNMKQMFRNASSFNQDLGSWNLANLSNADNMFDNSGMSCENMGKTINGWRFNTNTPSGITLGVNGMDIPTDVAANDTTYLHNIKGWTFAGTTTPCSPILATYTMTANSNPIATGDTFYSCPGNSDVLTVTGTSTDSFELYQGSTKVYAGHPNDVGYTFTSAPSNTGWYYVYVYNTGGTILDSFYVNTTKPTITAVADSVNCHGASDGSITTSVVGGEPGYTYVWSTSALTPDISGIPAGLYNVAVYDQNLCTSNVDVWVYEPALLKVDSAHLTHILCSGASTGAIDAFISGGSLPYTYSWNNGAYTTEDLSNVPAGTYHLEVSDYHGCSATADYTLTEPSGIVIADAITNVSCNGLSDGAIDITVTGGVTPYTYDWGTNGSSEDLTGLAAGVYNVTVTDSNLCTKTGSYTVTEPAVLTISSSTVDSVDCNGTATGSITVNTVTGGTAPYSYSWNGGTFSNSADTTGLLIGNYTLQVKDAHGCTYDTAFTVSEPAVLAISNTSSIDSVTCNGGSNGAINLDVTGGTIAGGYNYSWTGPNSYANSTEDISGLIAGTYSVHITDYHGCTVDSSFTVEEPSAPLAITAVVDSVNCNGNSDGSIDITVTGGTYAGGYSYSWTGPNSYSNNTEDISSLAAGAYTVTVTDYHNCSVDSTITVSEPAVLAIGNSPVIDSVNCNGGSDGSIDITVSGGSLDYSYSWTGPNSYTNTTDADITGLIAGTYNVTVTDYHGCTTTGSYTVEEPTAPLAITSSTVGNTSCYGSSDGSVSITVSGGTYAGGYHYSWTGPNSYASNTEDISGLAAGTYSVHITDYHNCEVDGSFTVTQPDQVLATPTVDSQTICNTDAITTISYTSNYPGATYSWTRNHTGDVTGMASSGTGDIIGSLTNTTTSPIVVDFTITPSANGCTGAVTHAYVIVIPTVSVDPITPNPTYCNTTTTSPINFTGLFDNITWTNDNTAIGLSANGTGNIGSFTATNTGTTPDTAHIQVVGLRYGIDGIPDTASLGTVFNYGGRQVTYSNVKLNDGNRAVSVAPGSTVNLKFDAHSVYTGYCPGCHYQQYIGVGSTNNTIHCFDDQGTSTRNYSANDNFTAPSTPGIYYLNFNASLDFNCIPMNFGNGASNAIAVLYVGVSYPYSSDSCTDTMNFSIVVNPTPHVTAVVDSVNCYGGSDGSINITPDVGVPTFSYDWGAQGTSEDLSGLSAGDYTVEVTDGNSCVGTQTFTVLQPDTLVIVADVDSVNCKGGSDGAITLTVTGGSTPYTFLWSNSEMTQNLTGLDTGSYGILVKDYHNCLAVGTYLVSEPDSLLISAYSIDSVHCYGASTGGIDITVTGGSNGYTYSWKDSTNTEVATTQDLTNAPAGVYTVTVSDYHNCSTIGTYTIEQPTAPLAISYVMDSVNCNGGNDGSIDLTVTGGTLDYSYSWSNSASSQDISNVSAGAYTVTVTDHYGCSLDSTINVLEPAVLAISTSTVDSVNCNGGSDGSISLTIAGGSLPYSYAWTGPNSYSNNTEDISGLAIGTYDVTITDYHGCSVSGSFTVHQPDSFKINSVLVDSVTCNGDNNGAISIEMVGGSTPFIYSWTGPNNYTSATEDITGLVAGSYSVHVSDYHGCSVDSTIVVEEPTAPLAITLDGIDSAFCYGASTGAVNITVTGGTLDYTYSWKDGSNTEVATTQDLTNAPAGTYTVTVSDYHGCSTSGTYTIEQPLAPLSVTATIDSVNCNGGNDGSIVLSVTGGTPGYHYIWSGGQTTPSITGLIAGSYGVTVYDYHFCTATASYVVHQPDVLSITDVVTDSVNCNGGSDGSIAITVAGGSLDYSYSWKDGSNTEIATTQNLINVSAGSYTVTVSDYHGCSTDSTIIVGEPSAPLAITNSVVDTVTCHGGSDGSIELTIAGGTAPYSYAWTGTNSYSNATEDISGLPTGTYDVTVTDARGCSTTGSYTVAEPAAIVIALATTDNTDCATPNGSLTVSGLVPTWTYTVTYNGAGQGSYTADGSGNIIFNNLATGMSFSNVSVTNSVGCVSNIVAGSTTISGVSPVTIAVATTDNTSCTSSDGAMTISGLTSGDDYTVYYDGASQGTYTADGSGTVVFNNLGTGTTYNNIYVVSTASNCTSNTVSSATVGGVSPATVNVASTVNNTNCTVPNGSITIGGLTSGNYTGTTYTVSYTYRGVVSSQTVTGSGDNVTISGLARGNYSDISVVNVSSGCVSSNTTSAYIGGVVVNTIAINNMTSNTSCVSPDGSLDIIAATPYDSLAQGAVYSIYYNGGYQGDATVVGNSLQHILLSGLSTGAYSQLYIVSPDGCSSNLIDTSVTGVSPVTIASATSNSSSCSSPDGSITLSGLDNGAGYTVYYNGAAQGSYTANSGSILLSGLSSGDYSDVYVVSDNGTCTSNHIDPVTINGVTPATVAVSNVVLNTSCATADGSITLSGLGSGNYNDNNYTVYYTYDGVQSNQVVTGTSGSVTITGLAAGAYTDIYVENTASGCPSNLIDTVLGGSMPAVISVSNVVSNSSCTTPDGTMTISGLLSGNNTGTDYTVYYTYNGTPSSQSFSGVSGDDVTLTGLATGTYSNIYVSNDASTCQSNAIDTVLGGVSPAQLATATTTDNSSCSSPDGTITLSGTIADGDYTAYFTYDGTPSSQSATASGGSLSISGLLSGAYSDVYLVSVTGTCTSDTQTATVNGVVPAVISVSNVVANSSCTTPDGTITISGLSSGHYTGTDYTVSYTYNGTPSSQTFSGVSGDDVTLTGLATGTYSNIYVSNDASTCQSNAIDTVLGGVSPAQLGTAVASDNGSCTNPDGTITLSGTIADGAYTVYYTYGMAQSSQVVTASGGSMVLTGLNTGAYNDIYAVSNSGSCTSDSQSTVVGGVEVANITSVTVSDNTSCSPADGSITLTGTIVDGSYVASYTKDGVPGGSQTVTATGGSAVISGLYAGSYTDIQLTSGSGTCPSNAVVATVGGTQAALVISNPTGVSPSVCNLSDGSITISGTFDNLSHTVSYDINGATQTATATSSDGITMTISGLPEGIYDNIFVSDVCPSNAVGTVVLTAPGHTAIALSGVFSNINCSAPNGKIVLTSATGASYPLVAGTDYDVYYNGSLQTTVTAQGSPALVNITGLPAGNYNDLYVVAPGGCGSDSIDVTVNGVNPAPIALSTVTDNTNCVTPDGSITLSGMVDGSYDVYYNGTAQGSATASSGSLTISGLGTGSYNNIYLVSQLGGCTSSSVSTVVGGVVPATISATVADNTNCTAPDGSVTVTGMADGTYDVYYNGASQGTATASGNTMMISGLTAGDYTNLYITNTTSSCTSDTIAVTSVGGASPVTIAATTSDNSSCATPDGSITLSGFVSGVSYTVYYDGTSHGDSVADASGNIILTGLSSGTYSNIYVASTVGACTSNTISSAVVGGVAPATISAVATDNTECTNPNGSVSISGLVDGTTYTVYYNGSSHGDSVATGGGITVADLAPGAYNNLYVVSSQGCQSNAVNATVGGINPSLEITSAAGANPTVCNSNDGTITLNGTFDMAAHTVNYTKDGVPGSQSVTSGNGSSLVLTGLGEGAYSNIYIADACPSNMVALINLESSAHPSVVVSNVTDNTNCNAPNGTITLSDATGTTAPLTDGTSYAVYVNGSLYGNVTASGAPQATLTLTGLPTGMYTDLYVETSGGCSSNTIDTSVDGQLVATVTAITTSNTNCSAPNGSIKLSPVPDGAYTVYYNGSAHGTANAAGGYLFINGLGQGNYTDVYIESQSVGCISNVLSLVTVNGLAPVTITQVSDVQPSCGVIDGSITLGDNFTDGTSYTVTYNLNEVSMSMNATASGGSLVMSGLKAGSYTDITVTEMGGCTSAPYANAVVLGDPDPSSYGSLADNGDNDINWQGTPTSVLYVSSDCKLIAKLETVGGIDSLGSVTATVTTTPSVQIFDGKAYMPRVYDINTTNHSGATVTLYYTDAEIQAYNAAAIGTGQPAISEPLGGISNIYIMAYHNAGVDGPVGYGLMGSEALAPTNVTHNGNIWSVTFNTDSFSGFFAQTFSTPPLALKLKSIDAVNIGSANRVDWQTAVENEGDGFEVERSKDGKVFEKIGAAEAKGIMSGSHYSFIDATPYMGINYYRLQLVSADGSRAVSEVVSATVKGDGFNLTAYPNPVSDKLTVKLDGEVSGKAEITLTDALGRVIEKHAITSNGEVVFPMNGLAQGMYLIRYADSKTTQTIKVNKQ